MRAHAGIARIEVDDTGIGVGAELRASLFQPFTPADSSTTRHFGGSGPGLSICRELATLMGGDVGLDSDGRNGPCAWVDLPLVAASEDDFTTIASLLEEAPQQPLQSRPAARAVGLFAGGRWHAGWVIRFKPV